MHPRMVERRLRGAMGFKNAPRERVGISEGEGHPILRKEELTREDYLLEVAAPDIAAHFRAGQFVVIRLHETGERIPLTIADADPEKGTLTIIAKRVGKTSCELGTFKVGDCISDILGPLGHPSETGNFGTVVCVGGGTGIAALHPIARALKQAGNHVINILGARSKGLLFWEDRFRQFSDELIVTTDDGSHGRKGVVTIPLKELLAGKKIGRVISVGPAVMMKFVALATKEFGVKTIVSLNPVMVDGTGMCGSCRVFVGGEMKLVCIDGPEFDAHTVNFDDLLSRLAMFKEQEKQSFEHYGKCGGGCSK